MTKRKTKTQCEIQDCSKLQKKSISQNEKCGNTDIVDNSCR